MDAPLSVLEWDRGALEAECDRGAAVQAGVEAYLGRKVFGAAGSSTVRVKLSRVEENGRARVIARVTQETSDGRSWGEREVAGDASCASLDEPVTLVVALLVDAPEPEPALAEPLPASEPPAPPSSYPDPPAADAGPIETAPSLEQASRAPGQLVLLALGLLSMGGLPDSGGGAAVLALLKPRGFWGLGVQAGGLLPQRTTLGSGSLETSLLWVNGSVCPLQGVEGKLWWNACGSIGAARLHARSRQVLEPRSRSDWFAVPGAAARGGWIMGRGVLLSAGLEAVFPVTPDSYVYRSTEGEKQLAFEPSRLMITAQLGVGLLLE